MELVYTAQDGTETRELVHQFDGPGIAQGMHNLNGSIESFARSCFNYALDTKAGSLVCHQGYHFQEVRPYLQGYFPGDL